MSKKLPRGIIMPEKLKKNFIFSSIPAALFLLLILLVKTVDVKPIGPMSSEIGLASLNGFMFKLLGESTFWYKLTELLGYFAILVVLAFGALGVYQLVTKKSIKKVDMSLIALGGFYVLVAVVYAFFEVVVVNYRPVILDSGLEASFPSSHTVLTVCIMATAAIQLKRRISDKKAAKIAQWVCFGIAAVTVIGRLLSGVHWFTDILGGLLISAALVMLYYSVLKYLDFRRTGK